MDFENFIEGENTWKEKIIYRESQKYRLRIKESSEPARITADIIDFE